MVFKKQKQTIQCATKKFTIFSKTTIVGTYYTGCCNNTNFIKGVYKMVAHLQIVKIYAYIKVVVFLINKK